MSEKPTYEQLEQRISELEKVLDKYLVVQKEETLQDYIQHLENLDRVDAIIRTATEPEKVLGQVMDTILNIFNCDRVWLLYPCDPKAPSWSIPLERTRPEYPGAYTSNQDIAMTEGVIEVMEELLETKKPIQGTLEHGDPEYDPDDAFNIRSYLLTALRPKIGKPWQFGLHQCSYERVWSDLEIQLFNEISSRISHMLGTRLMLQDLKKSEAKYRSILETMDDLVFISNSSCQIEYMNPALIRKIGRDARGDLCYKTMHNFTSNCPWCEHEQILKGKSVKMEIAPPGSEEVYLISKSPIERSSGPPSILSIYRDITEQKKIAAQKEAEHRQLISIFDGMSEVIYVADPETHELLYSNEAFKKVFGNRLQEKCYRAIQNSDQPCSFCTNHLLFGKNIGKTHTWEHQNKVSNRWYRCMDRAIKWPDGRMVRFELAIDITDRKTAETNLKKTTTRLESLGRIAQIADKDIKTIYEHVLQEIQIITASPYAFYGVVDETETMLKLHAWSENANRLCTAMEDKVDIPINSVATWVETIRTKKPVLVNELKQELQNRVRSTPEAPILKRCMMIPIAEQGRVVALAGVANKETNYNEEDKAQALAFLRNAQILIDRNNSEKELIKITKSLEEAQRISSIGSWEWDLKENSIWWSDQLYHIYGTDTKSEPPTMSEFLENVHPDDRGFLDKTLKKSLKTGRYEADFRLIKSDTLEIRDLYAEGEVHCDENGQPIKRVGYVKDVTEEKEFEQKLQQIQKMESIGNLAGGIAHDFNNLLAPIIGISELLQEDLPKNSSQYADIDDILQAGKRGADLVKQILSFSRQNEQSLIPIRLQKILQNVIKLIRATIPTYIIIEYNLQHDCGQIEGDPTQIHQVVMNIITNAYHALEDMEGKIVIKLEESDSGPEGLLESPANMRYALLSVTDNGSGIPDNILTKIFDPYFTTKEEGRGTGLGLSVVYGIIQSHNGHITVDSEVGKGTVFRIYLPLMPQRITQTSPIEPTALPRGVENIFILDDEPVIAESTKRQLERLGYTVTSRTHPIEAIEAFKVDAQKYDLFITDMAMPVMTGTLVAREVRKIRQDLPIVICTGFSNRIQKQDLDELEISDILMKPIVRAQLAVTVRETIDNHKKMQ